MCLFLFFVKILLPAHDKALDPADYEMIGMLGQITSAIRDNGTGEMSFSQAGVRRSAAAGREAAPHYRGTEVIHKKYEAYVRPWEELTDSKETV